MTGWTTWSLPLGALFDAAVGDPRGWPHPVRAIGAAVAGTEKLLRSGLARSGGGAGAERVAGVALTALVVGATGTVAWGIVALLDRFGEPAATLGRALLIGTGLAARSLRDETLRAAEAADLPTARRELAMIVGRDTADLDWPEIHRACLETVGENASDGVIAPLFWCAIAGPVGLWAYKAVSTLDSMVGYRDDRYRDLGWASARLDDLACLIPARLTWLLIALASLILGERSRASLRIGWRDGRNHPSPNSAWGEAALAGALGVRLGGPATYGGRPGSKPYLGDPLGPIEAGTIRRAIRLLWVASALAVLLAWAARWGLLRLA
jgi:adenosylcobinamide-phosphate synthase